MAKTAPITVTGMAWVTALGDDLPCVWKSLLRGESGLKPTPYRGRLRNSMAAAAMEAKMPSFDRQLKMATKAIRRALEVAGLAASDPDLQLVLGTSLGAYLDNPAWRGSLSGWARKVTQELGIGSAPIVLSTACSSGSDAILVAAELIRAGMAKRCVCGGVDVLTDGKRLAHTALTTMSPTQLRAFDVRHDGTLLGEGAGFLVLEAQHSAGRPALAVLRGVGSANDATGMTVADTTGLSAAFAIERSLADADLSEMEIGLVNAHGSGTPMNDTTESNAFAKVFSGPNGPTVFATKGNFGHTLGATGAIEAIAVILALESGELPPIVGLEEPLVDFPLPLASSGSTSCKARFGLSLTLGFGGFDTSLIFEAAS
jgi:3-oxoacyl-[acyl-carrier-protein] synthase II